MTIQERLGRLEERIDNLVGDVHELRDNHFVHLKEDIEDVKKQVGQNREVSRETALKFSVLVAVSVFVVEYLLRIFVK